MVINHYSTPVHHVTWTVLAVSSAVTRQRDPSLSEQEREVAWLTQDQWPQQRGERKRHDPLVAHSEHQIGKFLIIDEL